MGRKGGGRKLKVKASNYFVMTGGWPTYNCESAGARTALKLDENHTENVSSDDNCKNECDNSPQGCDFFSWNRRSKDCNLAKVIC